MGDLWSGFTSGLANLGSNIGNMFSGTPAINPSFAQLPSIGIDTSSLGTTPVDSNMFGGMGNFLTSKGGQGLMKTGFEGFNALNNYKMGNKQMDLANKQFGMQQDAYNTDKLNAENRENLRF
jgi:hypothetical protein